MYVYKVLHTWKDHTALASLGYQTAQNSFVSNNKWLYLKLFMVLQGQEESYAFQVEMADHSFLIRCKKLKEQTVPETIHLFIHLVNTYS